MWKLTLDEGAVSNSAINRSCNVFQKLQRVTAPLRKLLAECCSSCRIRSMADYFADCHLKQSALMYKT